jgi:tetratricopeptide (TPR) repeat protein
MIRTGTTRPTALLLALALASCLTGCSSGSNSLPPPAERLSRANALAERAEEALADENYEEAVELYRESVGTSGTVANWNNLGLLLMEADNYAGAVSAFRRAAELEPTDPRPVTNIGIAFYRAGWASDAIEHFDRALGLDPNYVPALRGYIAAADAISRATEQDLDRIRTALLHDADPEWRSFFERRRSVVASQLREQERQETGG